MAVLCFYSYSFEGNVWKIFMIDLNGFLWDWGQLVTLGTASQLASPIFMTEKFDNTICKIIIINFEDTLE